MIDINSCVKNFVKYSKKFDLKNSNIMGKFHHTFRVMEYSKDIARSLKLSQEQVMLASLCGLLHDIGRYSQFKKYQTYSDSISIDHGDLGYEILMHNDYISKYVKDCEEQQVVLKAVKYHNKYSVGDDLSDLEQLMANIVRDADKLDILIEQCNSLTTIVDNPNMNLVDNLLNHQLSNNVYVKEEIDYVYRELCFIFDINYKYSFEIIKNNNIIENKMNLLKNYVKNNDVFDKVENDLNHYVNQKLITDIENK